MTQEDIRRERRALAQEIKDINADIEDLKKDRQKTEQELSELREKCTHPNKELNGEKCSDCGKILFSKSFGKL